MEIEKKWIYIILGAAAFAIIFYFIYTWYIKSSASPTPAPQQAATQVNVPTPTLSPTPFSVPIPPAPSYNVLNVSPLSYLANYAGQLITVASTPPQMQIGDSYWVGFNLPNGMLVLMPLPLTTAQQLLNQNLLVPNTSLQVRIVPTQFSSELDMQSSTYAAYGTTTITLTAGILRSIMRSNKTLFQQLYRAINIDNYPLINSIISSLSGNPQLQSVVKTLAVPGNLVAPLAISYNAGMTLGIVPPQIQQYITNPNNVVIDFGYA